MSEQPNNLPASNPHERQQLKDAKPSRGLTKLWGYLAAGGQKLGAYFDAPFKLLFGRDIFISYSRGDGHKYAPKLANVLRSEMKGVSLYLDRWIAPPSGELPRSLRRHLRWSSLLVVIVTENAVRSKFVKSEILRFAKTGRQIIPVTVGKTWASIDWETGPWKEIKGAAPEPEAEQNVVDGIPSPDVVERIKNSITFTRQDQRLSRAVRYTVLGILLLIVGAVAVSNIIVNRAQAAADKKIQAAELKEAEATRKAVDAETRATTASAKEVAATAKATAAEGRAQAADSAALKAGKKAAAAQSEAAAAARQQQIAEGKAAESRRQQAAAEQLKRRATAERLVAEARKELGLDPTRSLLLSMEALKATMDWGEQPLYVAEEVFLDALQSNSGQVFRNDSNNRIKYLAHGPKGLLVLVGEKNAELWQVSATPSLLKRLSFPLADASNDKSTTLDCTNPAFSPEGRWLVAICGNRPKYVWDLRSDERELQPSPISASQVPVEMAFAPDALWLYAQSLTSIGAPFPLDISRLIKGETGAPAAVSPAGEERHFVDLGRRVLSDYVLSPDGRWVVRLNEPERPMQTEAEARTDEELVQPKTWSLYDLRKAGMEKFVRRFPADINFDRFSEHGHWLVTRRENDTEAQLWNLLNAGPNSEPITLRRDDKQISHKLKFSPDGRWVLDVSGKIPLWHLGGKKSPLPVTLCSRKLCLDEEEAGALKTDKAKTDANEIACGDLDTSLDKVEFSPDSKWLVAVEGRDRAIYSKLDGGAGSVKFVDLVGQSIKILDFRFSPDSRWLYVRDADGARLRNLTVEDREVFRDSTIVTPYFQLDEWFVAYTPDSHWLVTSNFTVDKFTGLKLLNLHSANPTKSFITLEGAKWDTDCCKGGVVISPDSHWLTMSRDDGVARLYNLRNIQSSLQPQRFISPGHYSKHPKYSPDNHWLVTQAVNQPPLLWELNSDNPLEEPTPLAGTKQEGYVPDPGYEKFSPDSGWLVTTGDSDAAHLYDLRGTARPHPRFDLRAVGKVVKFSPTSKYLATAYASDLLRVCELPLTNWKDDCFDLPVAGGPVNFLGFSSNSRWLITGTETGPHRLWDLKQRGQARGVDISGGWQIKKTDSSLDTFSAKFSSDGRWLSILDMKEIGEQRWRLLDLFAELPDPQQIHEEICEGYTSLHSFSADGRWLLAQDEKSLWLHDLESRATAARPANLNERGKTLEAAFSPDGHRLAILNEEKAVLLNLREKVTGKPVPLVLEENSSALHGLYFSPDGHRLIYGRGNDGVIRNLKDPSAKGQFLSEIHLGKLDPYNSKPYPLVFSPDGQWLITASSMYEGQQLWDLRLDKLSPRELQKPGGAAIKYLAGFSRDSRWLIAEVGNRTAFGDREVFFDLMDSALSPHLMLNGAGGPSRGDLTTDLSNRFFYFPRAEPSRLTYVVASRRKLQLSELFNLARQAAGYELNDKEREALHLVNDLGNQQRARSRVGKRPNSISR